MKSALDSAETARNNGQVDRAVESASRTVEGLLKRRFYPWTGTRYKDWPNHQYARSWRLWLDADELISLTSLVAGGLTIPAADYFLEPANTGPPYTRVEIDLDSSSAFSPGTTHQRAIALTGVFGYTAEEEAIGALTGQLTAGAASTASVSWTTAKFGTGDILRIDNERLVITNRTTIDSTQNLGAPGLTADRSNVTVPVSNGAGFAIDEILLIDSERMLIVDIAGNTLAVKRAWDGSVLAAHTTNTDIYSLTGVELARGQLGTSDATHANGATIYRHLVPSLVRDLTIAEAMTQLLGENSGWSRTSGSGDNQRDTGGQGLPDIRDRALARYGRKARSRAV